MPAKKRRKKQVRQPAVVGSAQDGFADLLDLSKIEDPPTRVMNRSRGVKSGLGVRLYIWNLLLTNERLPKSKKLTNTMIEKNVREEFPDRQALHDSLDAKLQTVNWWRLLFNKNQLITMRSAPPMISLRYDHHGDVVDSRTGTRVMTEAEIVLLCRRFEIEDPRYTG
jgi:hypothetical protein